MTKQKTKNNIKICVIGPGVVGQATGKVFANHGFPVTFWGRGNTTVEKLKKEGFSAYTLSEIQRIPYDFDISILIVPTPTVDGKINLEAMRDASIALGERLRTINKYHVVVVKSTVPPGTTENLVIKEIEEHSGKKVGKDFGACMNPEFLREKSPYEDFLNSRLVLIGEYDKKSGDLLKRIYSNFTCPIQRVSIKEAEMQKYTHNLFNAVKTSFFNEMRQVCTSFGLDSDKVFSAVALSAEGMWNPIYGTKNLGPFDGMCLPKDTQAFITWAKELGINLPILESAIKFNTMLLEQNTIDSALPSTGGNKIYAQVEQPIFPTTPDYVS